MAHVNTISPLFIWEACLIFQLCSIFVLIPSSCETWSLPPLTKSLLTQQCLVPLQLPSITPPHLCFSNSSHKSLLPAMLSWSSSSLFFSKRGPERSIFSLPSSPVHGHTLHPMNYATFRIAHVSNFMPPSSSSSSSTGAPYCSPFLGPGPLF